MAQPSVSEQPRAYQDLVRETPTTFQVHRTVYTDPQIFEAEMRSIFETTWVYVAHASEVPQAGDFRTAYIGQQPVIVIRDDDQQINVLLNVCHHRGNALCRDESGHASFLRCPYHGWTYKNNGELIGVPYRQGYPEGFDRDIPGLVRVPHVAVYHGLIFASLNPDVVSLDEHLGALKPYVDRWAELSPEGEMQVLRPHRFRCAGNWKFHLENGTDGYHPQFVHESAFSTRAHFLGQEPKHRTGQQDIGDLRGFEGGHCVLERPGMGAMDPSVQTEYMARLVRRHGERRAQDIVAGRNILVFPNLYLMDFNIRIVQPISVDETEMYSHCTALSGVPEEVNTERLRDVMWRYSNTGFITTDDVEIFAGNQSGLAAEGMEWLVMSRGIDAEELYPTGMRRGHVAAETTQRALYREWVRLMSAAAR